MLVIATKFCEALPELIAYQLFIVKQAKKFRYPSWLYYDIEYRKLAAAKKNVKWSELDPQLHSVAFTNQGMALSWCSTCHVDGGNHTFDCPNFKRVAIPTVSPLQPAPPLFQPPPLKQAKVQHCILFNRNNGACPYGAQCKYPHKCASCTAFGHPAASCPQNRRRFPFNN